MASSFLGGMGTAATSLILKVGFALVAIIILAVLFFAARYGFAAWRRYKTYKVLACIYNPDGTWYTVRIGKFLGGDKIDKMQILGSNETMPVIDPKHIRANRCTLWRYGVGQYAIIPPTIWQKLRPQDFKIEVIDMQMKNFAFLEQRAAVSRWAYLKDALQKYAPYITIMLVLIFAGVAIYFMMKTGLGMFNDVVQQRVAECTKLIGGGSTVTPPA